MSGPPLKYTLLSFVRWRHKENILDEDLEMEPESRVRPCTHSTKYYILKEVSNHNENTHVSSETFNTSEQLKTPKIKVDISSFILKSK